MASLARAGAGVAAAATARSVVARRRTGGVCSTSSSSAAAAAAHRDARAHRRVFASIATRSRRVVVVAASSDDGGAPDGAPPDGDGAPPPPPPPSNALELLSLLVVTGGVKGSLAVGVGYLVGVNAISMIRPDLASSLHGLEWALPVALVDALVMLPRYDLSEAEEDAIDMKEKALGKPEKIRRALSRYQREEALGNPCRSMPAWQDALVASVARLTDEMFERAVVLGFLSAWMCDRAVEAGAEPYDAEFPAKVAAVAAAYLYLEVKLRRASRRNRKTLRAFRVMKDPITGKQKMVPMDDEVEVGDVLKTSEDVGGLVEKLKKKMATGGKSGAKKNENDAASADAAAAIDVVDAAADDAKARGLPPVPLPDVLKPTPKPGPAMTPPPGFDPSGGGLDGDGGASAVGSIVFNASVKQFFDGFRSRLTLLTQCACFITAPGGNLFAPIVGGLACDILYVVYQRKCLNDVFVAAGTTPADASKPPTAKDIRAARMTLLKRDLDRRRRALAGEVMDSIDASSVADGAKEFNSYMRQVVNEVKAAKGLEKTEDALTLVLDAIHEKFTPSTLNEMSERESVQKMYVTLQGIRNALVWDMDEETTTKMNALMRAAMAEGSDEGGGGEGGEFDALYRAATMTLMERDGIRKTASDFVQTANGLTLDVIHAKHPPRALVEMREEDAVDAMKTTLRETLTTEGGASGDAEDVLRWARAKLADADAAAAAKRAAAAGAAAAASGGEASGVALGDVASLGAAAPPPTSLRDAVALEKKREEAEARQTAAEDAAEREPRSQSQSLDDGDGDDDDAVEKTGVNATIDALDRLVASVDERLRSGDDDDDA